MTATLQTTLIQLGYNLTFNGIEQAFLDGVVTEAESVELADAATQVVITQPISQPPPRLFNKNKFEKARSRFRIGTLGETEKDAYTRYHRETNGLYPAVVHVGPDGRYYAFGNRKKAVALIARQTNWI